MQITHKKMIALAAVAGIQKAGGTCAWIDYRAELSTDVLTAQGVDLAALLISQPESIEQAIEIADTLLRTGAIDMLVIDGVPSRWRLADWSRYSTLVLFTVDK